MMQAPQESIRFQFGSASDVGRKRSGEQNQDALAVLLPVSTQYWHPPLLMLADGLGGYQGGSIASQLAIDVFGQEFQNANHPGDYPQLLRECVQKAHVAIRTYGTTHRSMLKMGTTIVAVVLQENHLYALNVGDSRAYLIRGTKIFQITQDQSWVASQVRAGVLTPEQAAHHPGRNHLEMAITASRPEVIPYLSESILEKNDIVVLCSDGLWSVVPDSLIWAAVMELPPQVAAGKLVDLANRSGGPDNISAVVARRTDFQPISIQPNLKDTNP